MTSSTMRRFDSIGRRGVYTLLTLGLTLAVVVATLDAVPALRLRFALVVAGIAAVVVGLRIHRPQLRRPWLLLAAGMTSSALGDAIVLVISVGQTVTANVPADAWLTALSGLLIFAAMFDATRAVRGSELGTTLDAVVVALAGGTLIWHAAVAPAAVPGWAGSGVEVAGAIQMVLYVTVMGLLIRTIRGIPSGHRVAVSLLLTGLTAALFAFLLGAVRDAAAADMSHYAGARASLGAAANLLAGSAALHPTMRSLTLRREPPQDRLSPARSIALGLALACPPFVLVAAQVFGATVSVQTLAASWALLVPAVMLRMYLLARSRDTAQQQVRATEARLSALVANTSDVLLLVEHESATLWRVVYASPAAARVFDRKISAIVGAPISELVIEEDTSIVHGLLAQHEHLPAVSDVRIQTPSSLPRWMSVVVDAMTASETRRVVTLRDVTDRKHSELRLEREINRDPLTGLLNRRGTERTIEALIDDDDAPQPFTVLVADLDGFKPINDTHGHPVGDEVLRVVGTRLRTIVRDTDHVGRFGGDEFVIVFPGLSDNATVDGICEQLIAEVSRPIQLASISPVISVGISVGVTTGDPSHDSLSRVVRRADVALYEAKRSGRGRWVWFSQAVDG